MSVDRDDIWDKIKPLVSGLIAARISQATLSGGGVAVGPHDLGGSSHTGTLLDSQAPQFLLRDGSRSVTGNLSVGAGITIDGVDIDVFKTAYDAHTANPDAHHARFTSIAGDTGSAAPTGAGVLTLSGGLGLTSTGVGNTLTVDLGTPSSLSVSSANATTAASHTHAVTSSSSPGAAASLLATDANGGIALDATLFVVNGATNRVGIGVSPSSGRLHLDNDLAEPAIRIQPSGVNGTDWLDLYSSSGATVPSMRLTGSTMLLGPGGSTAPDLRFRRSGTKAATLDDGAGGAASLSVLGKVGVGVAAGTPMLLAQDPGTEQLRLAYDASNYAAFTVSSGGNLSIVPNGDIVFDPGGNDLLPQTGYDLNIGALTRKYLTLHAAELWVETLVAQDTIATIGGRILVGPTTQLAADLASTGGGIATIATVGTATSGSVSSGTVATCNVPTGVVDGNVLIAVTHHYNGRTLTPPAGWTQILQNNTAAGEVITVYRRVASSEPASYSWTLSANEDLVVGMVAFSGVDTSTPVDTYSSQINTPATTSMTSPTVSAAGTGEMLVFLGMVDPSAGSVTSVTGTPPGGMTEQLEAQANGFKRIYIGTELLSASGATGTRTVTLSAARVNIGAVVLLKPASAGGSSTITVKHNQMRPGDVVYMEANGKIEFMAVVSGPTGASPGPYSYTVTRDLDGTGANAWSAGDAVFNTGVAGNGFIDLYSLSGVNGALLDGIYVYDNGAAASPFEGGTYGSNLAQESQFQLFPNALAANDAIYFGLSVAAWNNLYLNIATAASWSGVTGQWEYWNGTAWTTFSPTVTGAFTSAGAMSATWSLPLSGWASKTINGLAAYWVRYRITAVTSVTTYPRQGARRIFWRKLTAGPTIVGNVRNSTTYNDWSEHWAIGNLNGLYGYGTDVYGFAAGKYTGPAGTTPWISADATNGFRVSRGNTVLGQWDTTGAITVGQVAASQGNVYIDSTGLRLRTNTTVKVDAQTDGDLFLGTDTSAAASTYLSMFANAQTYNGESMAAGDMLLGNNSASKGNIKWVAAEGRLRFRGGTTTQAWVDSTGQLVAGGGDVILDSNGVTIKANGSSPVNTGIVKFTDGTGYAYAYIQAYDSSIRGLEMAVDRGSDPDSRATITAFGNSSRKAVLFLDSSGSGTASLSTQSATASAGLGVSNWGVAITSGGTGTAALAVGNVAAAISTVGSGNVLAAGNFYPSNQLTYGIFSTSYNGYSGIATNGAFLTSGAMSCGDWFRSVGATGWFNSTYGGGIFMQSASNVEIYPNNNFIVPSGNSGFGVVPATNWRVGIKGSGTAAGAYGLVIRNSADANLMYVENNGALWANSNWIISDAREKRDIRDLERGAADLIQQLRVKRYVRKLSGEEEIGLIAQEVQALDPRLAQAGMGGTLGIRQPDIMALLIASHQELTRRVAELERKLAA